MKNIVKFNEKEIEILENNGEQVMTSSQIAKALDYSGSKSITNLYNEHKAEFDAGFSQVIESMTSGNYIKKVRVFNREGAWLIGMFARTPKAAEFRKWVLTVLGAVVDNRIQAEPLVPVAAHMRRLPSGPKEIKLSEKARAEIGGIVKSCCAVAIREELNKSHEKFSALPFDPVPYTAEEFKIADWVKDATFAPDKIEEELKNITTWLHGVVQNGASESLYRLYRFFLALSGMIVRYTTIRAETVFAADMMKGSSKYSKENICDEIRRINTVLPSSGVSAPNWAI